MSKGSPRLCETNTDIPLRVEECLASRDPQWDGRGGDEDESQEDAGFGQ